MEFNLLNIGKKWEDWWVELLVFKWAKYEPGLFKVMYTHGKWEFDILGFGELMAWLKTRK